VKPVWAEQQGLRDPEEAYLLIEVDLANDLPRPSPPDTAKIRILSVWFPVGPN
jgi:hypothetical protein